MSPSSPTLSRSVEDYLKAIYGLSERGESASTSAIAEILAGKRERMRPRKPDNSPL